MIDKIFKKGDTEISRRDLIMGAGKVCAGAAVLYAGGLSLVPKGAEGASDENCLDTPIITSSGAQYPWPYVKLDPQVTADIAYENWYKGFCSYAVSSAILGQLQEKVGEPYKSFPIESLSFAHGGTVGWGTLCGTLFAAGISSSMTAGKKGEKVINDMMDWYSTTDLPTYQPKNPKATFKNTNVSGSPLCHISVGKWMAKEGVGLGSPERRDRCARLAADVARKTVELLNAMADGTYKPSHGSQSAMFKITAQNNCTDCHGSNIPSVPGI